MATAEGIPLKTLIGNMAVAGCVSFVVVALIVFLATFVAPIWIMIATAFPTSILLVLLIMNFSRVEVTRIRGTLVAYSLGLTVLAITVVTWAMCSLFSFRDRGPGPCLWTGFAVSMVVWVCVSALLLVFYLKSETFKTLLRKGDFA